MPRSPAPPRKGQQEGVSEDMALLTKLDTIRQEVEKLGERIQNFKVRPDLIYLYFFVNREGRAFGIVRS
jgi:hypothetical protein